jgi:hypothetical protein
MKIGNPTFETIRVVGNKTLSNPIYEIIFHSIPYNLRLIVFQKSRSLVYFSVAGLVELTVENK